MKITFTILVWMVSMGLCSLSSNKKASELCNRPKLFEQQLLTEYILCLKQHTENPRYGKRSSHLQGMDLSRPWLRGVPHFKKHPGHLKYLSKLQSFL